MTTSTRIWDPFCTCGHRALEHTSHPPEAPPYTPERRTYGKCGWTNCACTQFQVPGDTPQAQRAFLEPGAEG